MGSHCWPGVPKNTGASLEYVFPVGFPWFLRKKCQPATHVHTKQRHATILLARSHAGRVHTTSPAGARRQQSRRRAVCGGGAAMISFIAAIFEKPSSTKGGTAIAARCPRRHATRTRASACRADGAQGSRPHGSVGRALGTGSAAAHKEHRQQRAATAGAASAVAARSRHRQRRRQQQAAARRGVALRSGASPLRSSRKRRSGAAAQRGGGVSGAGAGGGLHGVRCG